jgi:hypothetical protein
MLALKCDLRKPGSHDRNDETYAPEGLRTMVFQSLARVEDVALECTFDLERTMSKSAHR